MRVLALAIFGFDVSAQQDVVSIAERGEHAAGMDVSLFPIDRRHFLHARFVLHGDTARLKAAGVRFIEEPNNQGGGFWLATFEDPDGNLIQLYEFGAQS